MNPLKTHMAVCSTNNQPRSQIGIRVITKSAGSENLRTSMDALYSGGRSFEAAHFLTEKRVREP
jgi:hypothetical protein